MLLQSEIMFRTIVQKTTFFSQKLPIYFVKNNYRSEIIIHADFAAKKVLRLIIALYIRNIK